MAELLEDIGHNIRRLREENSWNQTELGFHADMSPSIVSLIENGKRNPSTATLAKIASALGVEVVDLFPKASAPPDPTLDDALEEERREDVYDIALSAARRQVEKDRKEVNRTLASEGIQQPAYFKDHENEAITQLLHRSADELAPALIEMALRVARQEQIEQAAHATAEQPTTKAQSGSA